MTFVDTEFKHRARIVFVGIFLLLPLAEVGHRLADLQLQENPQYERYARLQSETLVKLEPLRGTIYDRNLTPLALSYRVNNVFAETRELGDVLITCASLAALVGMEPAAVEEQIRTTFTGEVVVIEGVNAEQRAAIIESVTTGIELRPNGDAWDVVARMDEITDIDRTSYRLARAMGTRSVRYEKTMRDSVKGHVLLAEGVSNEVRRDIQRLGLPGITFETYSRRSYPKGSLASHTLGFVGKDGVGLEGLERGEDRSLRGIEGYFQARRDRNGRRILSDDFTRFMPNGPDIVLTIDEYLQTVAEDLLAEQCEETEAKGGFLIAADPWTGEIVALANYPAYDPNEFGKYAGHYLNRSVAAVYEPGSVMKPITMAIALDAGAVRPETVFDCEHGRYVIGGRVIGDDVHSFGDLTCTDIIVRSSNIGVTKVAQKMGPATFEAGLRRFGFGERTGIDLPGEVPGLFTPLRDWSGSHIATMSYGQGGNSINAIQLVRAYCAIANGGMLPTPHVVKADRNPLDGELHQREIPPPYRVISEQTAAEVNEMLVLVTTDEHGTGEKARVPGYTVAGKTGTARVPRTDGPGYAWGKRIASFAGYLPAEDPKLVILSVIDQPTKGKYGGSVAGPLFSEFGSRAMRYLGVPRSVPVEPELLEEIEALPGKRDSGLIARVDTPVLPAVPAPSDQSDQSDQSTPPVKTAATVDINQLSEKELEQLLRSRRLESPVATRGRIGGRR